MIAKLTLRTVAILATGILLAVLLMWGPQACNSYFSQKTQIRVEKGQGEAGIQSGEMAVDTAGKNASDADLVDAAVKEALNEIRNAPDGNSNDAALRAACKLRSYERDERCAAMRKADSDKLEGRNPPR